MVVYNAATRELTAKIVYYGPGLGGKTTNLQLLHDRLEPGTVGKLLNLATHSDRTIYFDLLPVELGDIKGYKIRFQLATVPGQTAFNETRRVVLKGTDGVVFVADSQWTMLPKNLESWQNLKDNLKANAVSFQGIPIVIQYNKRDLPDILSIDAIQEALGLSSYPFVEAVATAGRGVTETFKLISKLTFVDLLRRLQGRRPDEAVSAATRREPDDLLSWKDSLLNRSSPPGSQKTRPLSLVATPGEEAPFETSELIPPEDEPDVSGPFAEAGEAREAHEAAAPAGPADTEEKAEPVEEAEARKPAERLAKPERPTRVLPPAPAPARASLPATAEPERTLRTSESRLREVEEAARALTARFEAFERDARALGKSLQEGSERQTTRLVEALEAAAEEREARLSTIENRLESEAKRQRVSEDDLVMALRSLHERDEKFDQQLASLSAQLKAFDSALNEKGAEARRQAEEVRRELNAAAATLQEKTNLGHREAEDIRQQLAPLLEDATRRQESDQRMLEEMDRLRESIAEALGDLSERLRQAVRGI